MRRDVPLIPRLGEKELHPFKDILAQSDHVAHRTRAMTSKSPEEDQVLGPQITHVDCLELLD